MNKLGWSVWSFALAFACVSTVGCKGGSGGTAQPKTEDEKTLYAVGVFLARQVEVFNLNDHELDLVTTGMRDVLLKRKPSAELNKVLEAARPGMGTLARNRAMAGAAKQKEKDKTALEAAAKEPGAVKTPSGLVMRTTKPGTGATPQPTDRVKTHYVGKLTDGTIIDSTRQRGEPAVFTASGGVKCWAEALGRMKVGETAVPT